MRIPPALAATFLIGTALPQQTPDSNVVIRSSTREVLLEVMVRDSHGKLVTKIDPEKISVFEDGVRQAIRSFRLVQGSEVRAEDVKQAAEVKTATAVPGQAPRPVFNPLRTVNVVCLILSDLTPDTRAFAFDAARKFVDNELRPDTYIGVFSLDSTGLLPVFPFSNHRENLVKAIELAAVNQLPALAQSTGAMMNGLALNSALSAMLNGLALSGSSTGGFGASTVTPSSTLSANFNASVALSAATPLSADGGSLANPIGTRGAMGVATQAGLREIGALKALVQQLSQLPFQKTVMLLSGGLVRPPDQLEYWNSLIHSANQGGVTFYGLDVNALLSTYDPMAASAALLQQSASLSQKQSSVAVGAEQTTPRAGGGVNIGASQADQLMESMHQTDYLRYGVLSANTQEALRELAESTGGFLIANTNNSERLKRVMEDVDTHYEISYRPASEIDDGHFRKVEVKLARPDLHVQTRSGYFAVPDTGEGPVTPAEMTGLRALDTKPRPHAFDFQSKAFRFRCDQAACQYAIAFEVPIANLAATPETAEKRQRFHASLLALVKNEQGQIVGRVSKDVPSEVADQYVPMVRAQKMTYEHAVKLAPGHYTVEAVVVDQEGNRASTNVVGIDNHAQAGLGVSEIALVHLVEDLQRPPDPADPFEITGKRATPFVSTALAAGTQPFVYFVVYPDKNNRERPTLQAKFLMSGHVLATQKSPLPQPDDTGVVPMAIHAVAKPGDYEVRVKIMQGRSSVEQSLKYTIAAK